MVDCGAHKHPESFQESLQAPDLIFISSVCLCGTHIAEDGVCNKSCINLSDREGDTSAAQFLSAGFCHVINVQ